MRLASYNVENLFDRARVLATSTWSTNRRLLDDAAVVGPHVLTTDTLVEGVHFLPADSPEDVAHKLLAVNLSDLAAKGAYSSSQVYTPNDVQDIIAYAGAVSLLLHPLPRI